MQNDPSQISNAALWAGIVGFLVPIAVAVITQQKWTSATKSVIAFVVCLFAAAGTAWFGGMFDPADIARNGMIVFTLAIASYYGFWKPTGIAPKIEAATSI